MSTPRAVVIGYGFAGRSFHSYLISLTPTLTLHGVASRTPETRQRIVAERGCKAYESFDEVLADPQVDLVVLATPSHAHAAEAIRALDAGKHVVTDKPMATSLADADAMIEAATRSGRVLSVFQNRRWDGDYLTVRGLIDDGSLGRVRRVEMAWSGFGMPGGWRGKRESGGGRVFDLGAHMIDQLLLLIPQKVASVYARFQYDSPGHDIESDAVIIVGFEDGATGLIEASSISTIPKPRFYVAGSGGTFVKYGLDPQEAWMKAGAIDAAAEDPANFGRLNTTGKPADTRIIATAKGRWRSYYENIADAIAGRAELAVTPQSVRRQIAVIDAAFESARTGEVVRTAI